MGLRTSRPRYAMCGLGVHIPRLIQHPTATIAGKN